MSRWELAERHWAKRIAAAEEPADQVVLAKEIVRIEREVEGRDLRVAVMRRENLRLFDRLRGVYVPPSPLD